MKKKVLMILVAALTAYAISGCGNTSLPPDTEAAVDIQATAPAASETYTDETPADKETDDTQDAAPAETDKEQDAVAESSGADKDTPSETQSAADNMNPTQPAADTADAKTPGSQAEPGTQLYTYTDLDAQLYAQISLRVRSLPSTDGEQLGVLSKGELVTVTGVCNETGWYRLNINGAPGYASNKYLLDTAPTAPVTSVASAPAPALGPATSTPQTPAADDAVTQPAPVPDTAPSVPNTAPAASAVTQPASPAQTPVTPAAPAEPAEQQSAPAPAPTSAPAAPQTPAQPETPAQPVVTCEHTWVENYQQGNVHHATPDNPYVIEGEPYEVEDVIRGSQCNACGLKAESSGAIESHILTCGRDVWVDDIYDDNGNIIVKGHWTKDYSSSAYEEKTTRIVTPKTTYYSGDFYDMVLVGYKCTACGATKGLD